MLPKNFDFAMLPAGTTTLREVGILASTIEDIDQAIMAWVKEDLEISTTTNEGFIKTPVLWQVPERSYQVKHRKDLRDDDGAFKLPLISIERTGIVKDPTRKGSFQAHFYSDKKNGRSGRMVIAKKIVQDKTRNFAAAAGTRGDRSEGTKQLYFPRINKRIVIKSLSIPIPVYINAEYKITLKSEYQQQMNTMMAPFIGRTGQINAFAMRRNGHLYEGFIDQGFTHSNNVNDLAEEVRMYTSEITIKVLGYLIGEGESDDRPIVEIHENIVEITFPNEGVVPEDNDNFFL
jgi:hypothetical protein|tara:strand:- start:26 stop:895 length:870 start_codon:yes stop_codon:yes gene_type:complete